MKTLNITKPAIRKLFFVRSPWSLGGLLGAGAVYYHLERYYSDSEEPLKYDAALDHFVERIASDLTKPTNHHNMWEGHIGRFLSLESAPELAFAKGPVYMCDLLKVVSWKPSVLRFYARLTGYPYWQKQFAQTDLLLFIIKNLEKVKYEPKEIKEVVSSCSNIILNLSSNEENIAKLLKEIDITRVIEILEVSGTTFETKLLTSCALCCLYRSPTFQKELKLAPVDLKISTHIQRIEKALRDDNQLDFVRTLLKDPKLRATLRRDGVETPQLYWLYTHYHPKDFFSSRTGFALVYISAGWLFKIGSYMHQLPIQRQFLAFNLLFFASFLALEASQSVQESIRWQSHNPSIPLTPSVRHYMAVYLPMGVTFFTALVFQFTFLPFLLEKVKQNLNIKILKKK